MLYYEMENRWGTGTGFTRVVGCSGSKTRFTGVVGCSGSKTRFLDLISSMLAVLDPNVVFFLSLCIHLFPIVETKAYLCIKN